MTPEIDPDPVKGSIKLTFLAEAETQQEAREKAISYVWKDFTYEAGKVTGWTGKSGPVKDVLWTRTTRDESRGRRAELKSAYLSNVGSMIAVVELSSSEASQFWEAEYTASAPFTDRPARWVRAQVEPTEQLYGDLANLQLGRVQVNWVHGRAQRTIRSPQARGDRHERPAPGGWALAIRQHLRISAGRRM